ncbi:MAG: hypothetical protein QXF61_11990, partial [Nitrososphaeria archaeon]
ITKTGHVPQWGVYGTAYGSNFGLHALVSAISIVGGLDVSVSMKVFLVIAPLIIPATVYFVTRKLNLPKTLSKLMIISTVVVSPATYIYYGTQSTYFLYMLFSSFLVLFYLFKPFDRRYLLITTISGFAILFSHMATSMTLIVIFALQLLAQINIRSLRQQKSFMLLYLTSYLCYLLFWVAGFDLAQFIRLAQDLISPLTGKETPFVSYYRGFFNLTFWDQLRVLMVRMGSYIITALLCLLSIPITLRFRSKNDKLAKLYYVLLMLSFIPASMFILSGRGFNVKDRFWCYFSAYSPFFAGITLWYFFGQRRIRLHAINSFVIGLVIFSLICFSSMQIFRCQPLVPKVPTEYGELYVMNCHFYADFSQRRFVLFIAEYNNNSTISTMANVHWQIYGLTKESFQALVVSRLESDLAKYGKPYGSVVLVSINQLDSSTTSLNVRHYLQKAIVYVNTSQVLIYTNGESYCFYKP